MNNMLKAEDIHGTDFTPELKFTAARSGGKGGQYVNKVSTKVELHFDYLQSVLLNDEQKRFISAKLRRYINKEGILKITSDGERSQLQNKNNAIKKFLTLLESAFRKPKKRIKVKPGAAYHKKRLERKKIQSRKKERRRAIHGE